MYFTKFPLNMTRRETRFMLASPYRLHAAIEGSFPVDESSDGGEGRVLWRVDRNADGSAVLYIVSPSIPSLVGLDEQIGWPDLEQQWQTRLYDAFLAQIENGQIYGFRLLGNPVVNRSAIRNGRGSSKRISHLTALQQAAWLVGREAYDEIAQELPEYLGAADDTRAERNGFVVTRSPRDNSLQLVVSDMRKLEFMQGTQGRKITLATARYDGVLEVRDANLLRRALTFGIGHGKGFGCGLLTLARVEPQ